MDTLFLSRIQFGLTSGFHYLYPPINIGLGLCLIIMEAMYLKTGKIEYLRMTKFWVKIFALVFALGVATGLVQLFGFGTNWAEYSRFVGDVFGSALGAEGIFAFFLEAGFLGVLLFGWERVSKRFHFIANILVSCGAHFSAIWILIANSWMQTPAGYKIVGTGADRRAVVDGFWTMVFNPSSLDRITHTVIGCWITGAFLVISISAYYLLKKRHLTIARASMKVGLSVALVALLLQLVSGDSTSRGVAVNQPAKLAAAEGVFKTEVANMYLFGWTDATTGETHGLALPKMLSFLVHRNFTQPVTGLDQIPRADWPPVGIVFQTYHLMIAMWGIMFVIAAFAVFLLWKNRLTAYRWFLYLCIFSVACPHIANMSGWLTAEIGRQPWVVYGVMRTSEGLSKTIVAGEVLASVIMFIVLYTALFAMFIFLLNRKIQHGPDQISEFETARDPFSQSKGVV